MPLSHAVLLLGAYLVLAADEVPRFDYEATCRAPLLPSDQGKGLEQACLNSQKRARSQLEQQWGQFSAAAKRAGAFRPPPWDQRPVTSN